VSQHWHEYYDDRRLTSFFGFVSSILYHSVFLFAILRLRPKRILEVGCGRGIQSIFLSRFIPFSAAVDADKNMIVIAEGLNSKFHGRTNFKVMDGRRIHFLNNSFDVVFSQGLLEHFDDENMVKFVDSWLKLSSVCVISVPSSEYGTQEFGDERLMTIQEYSNILKNYSTRYSYYGFKPSERGMSMNNFLQSFKVFNPKKYRSQILLIVRPKQKP
jgi:SAM-dependent methyltransferase